jgi:hypothetical protein
MQFSDFKIIINAGVHRFSNNLKATSQFYALDVWHEADSILRIQKYQAPLYKILSPGRPGARDLCTPAFWPKPDKSNGHFT